MNKLIIFSFIISCISCNDLTKNPSKSNLVWEDNFDDIDLNPNFWNIYSGNGCPELCGFGNNELQYYVNDSKTIQIKHGKLILTSYFDTISNSFKSAKITTNGKIDFHKGHLEVKAKLPLVVGSWPAIWLLPSLDRKLNWPLDGEIDIMENVGYDSCKIFGTIHTAAYNHTIGTQKSDSVTISTAHNEFHTYSLNWTDSLLEWYVDTILFNRIKRKSFDRVEKWPFNKDFHLIINLAVGGDWGGKLGIDTSNYPKEFIIDKVSLSKEKP